MVIGPAEDHLHHAGASGADDEAGPHHGAVERVALRGLDQRLGLQLRLAVGTEGITRVLLGERQRLREAVDHVRGDEDEVRGAALLRGLEDAPRAVDVDLEEGELVCAGGHGRVVLARREMEHGASASERVVERAAPEIAREVADLTARIVREVRGRGLGEIDGANVLHAQREQLLDDDPAEETGAARDDDGTLGNSGLAHARVCS